MRWLTCPLALGLAAAATLHAQTPAPYLRFQNATASIVLVDNTNQIHTMMPTSISLKKDYNNNLNLILVSQDDNSGFVNSLVGGYAQISIIDQTTSSEEGILLGNIVGATNESTKAGYLLTLTSNMDLAFTDGFLASPTTANPPVFYNVQMNYPTVPYPGTTPPPIIPSDISDAFGQGINMNHAMTTLDSTKNTGKPQTGKASANTNVKTRDFYFMRSFEESGPALALLNALGQGSNLSSSYYIRIWQSNPNATLVLNGWRVEDWSITLDAPGPLNETLHVSYTDHN